MQKKQKSLHKKIWIAVEAIFLLLVILAGVFFWYVSDYYRAEDAALKVLAQGMLTP